MVTRALRASAPLFLALALVRCGVPPATTPPIASDAPSSRTFKPIDSAAAVFWDRQTEQHANLLSTLAGEYNAGRSGLPLRVEYLGNYGEINRKVGLSIHAGELPAMAVGYESMTTEYVQAGAVVALDKFIHDPEIGFTQEEFDDFIPSVIETNRYPELGGKMYSFPFTKAVLMLYFNRRVLSEAGITDPPKTWDDFISQCRAVKEKTGKSAYAVDVDCSTINGMVFSRGGLVVEGRATRYDSPESVAAFELLETLAKEGLAYRIQPGSFTDREDFAQDRVAFFFRSSSHKTYLDVLLAATPESWGLCIIPQSDPEQPRTVLYGGNVCIFNTTPEQQRVAWGFAKYFTSKEVNVQWALATGYIPIRKSAAQDPDVQAFWNKWEFNRAAYDALAYARPEPNIGGWQEVRTLVERAAAAVLSGLKSGKDAATELKQQADAVLAAY